MKEQEYFNKYEELNKLLMNQRHQNIVGNEYVIYGLEQAIMKLQEDYKKQLNNEAKELIINSTAE